MRVRELRPGLLVTPGHAVLLVAYLADKETSRKAARIAPREAVRTGSWTGTPRSARLPATTGSARRVAVGHGDVLDVARDSESSRGGGDGAEG